MTSRRVFSILCCLTSFLAPAVVQAAIDEYGGNDALAKGAATGVFHVQRIGDRWFLIDPIGNAMFTRAVDGVNSGTAGEGTVIAYDTVYLTTGTDSGSFTVNLSTQGLSWGLPNDPLTPLNRDVVHPASRATVSQVGDAIYLGWKLPIIDTYFWADQLGQGGHIEWFYSTGTVNALGWKPLNQASQPGNPFTAWNKSGGYPPVPALNSDGSFNIDTGGYMARNNNGDEDWVSSVSGYTNEPALKANLLNWWDLQGQTMATDFTPTPLTASDGSTVDPTPLYYIKGVVTVAFSTPPVLNQVYERDYLGDILSRKYGGGGGDATWMRWADATTKRLRNWGLNSTNQYSNRYAGYVAHGSLNLPFPVNDTWQIGSWVTRPNNMPGNFMPFKVKSVYGNINTPDKNWQGMQPDAFEPAYESAMMQVVKASLTDPNKGVDYLKYTYQLVPEEGDHMYGIDSLGHQHMGYVVLVQNPYEVTNCNYNNGCESYTNPMVYSRYAMRDFLRYRYRDSLDTIPPLVPGSRIPFYSYAPGNTLPTGRELKALQNLNAAWGTSYTTWGTSSGDLLLGTNAWGRGSGFMDEDGQHVITGGAIYYNNTSSISPRVLPDLDDYVAFFTAQYGYILSKAFSQAPHPPLIMPLYNGPDYVFRNLSPYIDGYSVNISSMDALRLYNAGHKPIFTEDYSVANPDSQLFYRVVIDSVTWDPVTQTTWVRAPGMNFKFRMRGFAYFPEASVNSCLASIYHQNPGRTYYRPLTWDTVGIDEDDHQCIHPGNIMQWGSYDLTTQPARAQAMMNRWGSMFNLKGDDGAHFVLGLDHWMLYDDDPTFWAETGNFGLVSNLDNAYDGVQAMRSTTTVALDGLVGGEPGDYGNLLTQPVSLDAPIAGLPNPISLVDFWKSFDNGTIAVDPNAPVPPNNPTGLAVASTQNLPPTVNLTWQANASWENITGYTIYVATYSLLASSPTTAAANPSITRQSVAPGTSASVSVPLSDAYYFFRLTATNAAGESPFGNEVSTTTHPHVAPGIPTGLQVTGTQKVPAGITLAWNPNPPGDEISGYMVYYSSTNSMVGLTPEQAKVTSWVRIFSAGDVTAFPMTNLGNSQLYYVRLTAYNPFGESDFSAEVSTATPMLFPSTPTAFAVTATASQPQPSASFSWQLNVATDNVTGYTIYVATQSLASFTTGQAQAMGVRRVPAGPGPTFQVTGLYNDVTYYFRLSASNLGGESPFSNEVSTNTDPSGDLPPPTLNLPAILPVDAVISAGYSPAYQLSGFLWTISQTGSASAPSASARASGASGYSTSFQTPSYQASLGSLALIPGNYVITVKAVDTAGHISPPAQASVTLIPDDLGSVRIYPNPWRSDRAANAYITFDQLPLNSTVKIFTLSGHGLVTLASALDPTTNIVSAKWDLKNESGDKVASSLYLYLIMDDQGNKKKGQLAVIK